MHEIQYPILQNHNAVIRALQLQPLGNISTSIYANSRTLSNAYRIMPRHKSHSLRATTRSEHQDDTVSTTTTTLSLPALMMMLHANRDFYHLEKQQIGQWWRVVSITNSHPSIAPPLDTAWEQPAVSQNSYIQSTHRAQPATDDRARVLRQLRNRCATFATHPLPTNQRNPREGR